MDALIVLIQSIYNSFGVSIVANLGDLWGMFGIFFVLAGTILNFFIASGSKVFDPTSLEQGELLAPDKDVQDFKRAEVEEVSWKQRLLKGLSRSRREVWNKMGVLFSKPLDDEALEKVEELLYSADLGPTTVGELVDELQERSKAKDFNEGAFKNFLFDFLRNKMAGVQEAVDIDLYNYDPQKRGQTQVIMVVGVNGAGKTTTIGKLATKLTKQGAKVVVGACDTFRAAAVDQLEVWCKRSGAEMVRAKEGASPSGVGYEALQKAISLQADYCILDTAGRLHTKGNLMDELTKSRDVLKKLDNTAPHHILLVIDAITGQNAIRQAQEFHKALGLTGLILTKCDGSSKAGSAVAIVNQLQVPIAYIGVGEGVEDLNAFDLEEYLGALLSVDAADHQLTS